MSVSSYDTYTSPLATRNASPEMLKLWSARHKFNTWRKIWLAVAEAQCEMGLPVSREQVEELRGVVNKPGGITDEEMRAAERYERELRHDVMAHVHALGDSCPKAKGIIHLGMTSQDVVCNADLMVLRDAIALIKSKCSNLTMALGLQADRLKSIPSLAFTHYQAAQPTTVGRRLAQWSYEMRSVWHRLLNGYESFPLKGLRGATGTQASYLALCAGNAERVDELEARVISRLDGSVGFAEMRDTLGAGEWLSGLGVGGDALAQMEGAMQRLKTPAGWVAAHTLHLVTQTYPRVIDTFILADLASVASVLHKIATDIRLLCNRKEMDEPFEEKQIGSSAMPYKRNPMRCERVCGLARFVMNLVGNAYDTAATQWLERTLDDSSNRRLSLPEAFLALDGALDLMHNVASGLVVHEATVRKNLMAELPFMATENLLMACVRLGGDRQHYHELIRVHAQAAGMRVKQEGQENDLLVRLQNDPAFHAPALKGELDWDGLMDPMKYVGRSVEQTERFVAEVVEPLRRQYGEEIGRMGSGGPRV